MLSILPRLSLYLQIVDHRRIYNADGPGLLTAPPQKIIMSRHIDRVHDIRHLLPVLPFYKFILKFIKNYEIMPKVIIKYFIFYIFLKIIFLKFCIYF